MCYHKMNVSQFLYQIDQLIVSSLIQMLDDVCQDVVVNNKQLTISALLASTDCISLQWYHIFAHSLLGQPSDQQEFELDTQNFQLRPSANLQLAEVPEDISLCHHQVNDIIYHDPTRAKKQRGKPILLSSLLLTPYSFSSEVANFLCSVRNSQLFLANNQLDIYPTMHSALIDQSNYQTYTKRAKVTLYLPCGHLAPGNQEQRCIYCKSGNKSLIEVRF